MVLTSITDPILYFPYKPHWDHILIFDGRKPQLGALHCCCPSLGSSFSYRKKKAEAIYGSKLHQQSQYCTKSVWKAEGHKENSLSGGDKAIKKAFFK